MLNKKNKVRDKVSFEIDEITHKRIKDISKFLIQRSGCNKNIGRPILKKASYRT